MNTRAAFRSVVTQNLASIKRLILVVLLGTVSDIFAQEQLPVKDYTIGNKFVYLTFQEEVIADTVINGLRYGVVELSYQNRSDRLYMRSNSDTVFQYHPALLREQVSYIWGQGCQQNPFGISFLSYSFGNACGGVNESISSPLMLHYARERVIGQTSNWGSARIIKPFGITEIRDSNQYCRLEYIPGRGASRPAEFRGERWDTVCSRSETANYRLIAGMVRGQPIRISGNTSPYFLRWFASSKTIAFGQTQRVMLKFSNAYDGLSANNVGIRSVQCSFVYDSSLVAVISLKTSIGNKPDSLRYINGRAILYCTFLVDSNSVDLGYVDIQSKAV